MSFISEYGISHIVVMGNLYVIKEYYIFKLCRIAHNTVITYKRRTSYERTRADFGIVSYYARSSYVIVRISLCIFGDPDILLGMIIFIFRKCCPDLKNQFLDTVKGFPWICKAFEIISRCRMRQVIQIFNLTVHFYHLSLPLETEYFLPP